MTVLNELKEKFSRQKDNSSEYNAILSNLKDTKKEMRLIVQNIDYITDPILLNQLIFRLKATEMRYRYWFCMARDLNISGNLTII